MLRQLGRLARIGSRRKSFVSAPPPARAKDKRAVTLLVVVGLGVIAFALSTFAGGTGAEAAKPGTTDEGAAAGVDPQVAPFVGRWKTEERQGSIQCQDGTSMEPEMRDDVFELSPGDAPGKLVYHQSCDVQLSVREGTASLPSAQTCEDKVEFTQVQISPADEAHLDLAVTITAPFEAMVCTITAKGRAVRVG